MKLNDRSNQENRQEIAADLLSIINERGWNLSECSRQLPGVSSTTARRLLNEPEYFISDSKLRTIANAVAFYRSAQQQGLAQQPEHLTPVAASASEAMLPIVRNTGMLNERILDGSTVYSLSDAAEGLCVSFSTVWRHWEELKETGEARLGVDYVCKNENTGRPQDFLYREGLSLLCMKVGGKRASDVRIHLRDTEAAVANGTLTAEQQIMANVMAAVSGQISQAFGLQLQSVRSDLQQFAVKQEDRLGAIERRQSEINEDAIAQKAADLNKAYKAECAELAGQLERAVQEYAEMREMVYGGDQHEIFAKANGYLKREYAKGKPRNKGWEADEYRASLACVSRWMLRLRNSETEG